MHKCEPTLEELYELQKTIRGFDEESIKRMYAINSQINRHIKLRKVKED